MHVVFLTTRFLRAEEGILKAAAVAALTVVPLIPHSPGIAD